MAVSSPQAPYKRAAGDENFNRFISIYTIFTRLFRARQCSTLRPKRPKTGCCPLPLPLPLLLCCCCCCCCCRCCHHTATTAAAAAAAAPTLRSSLSRRWRRHSRHPPPACPAAARCAAIAADAPVATAAAAEAPPFQAGAGAEVAFEGCQSGHCGRQSTAGAAAPLGRPPSPCRAAGEDNKQQNLLWGL